MTATAMPVTVWQGSYGDSWQDLICPEAFAHPAKFARGLIHRIYRHLLEQGYVREGDTVLDPFGGVGLGALDAMTYGLRWIGCELEERFCRLGEQNLDLWRQRYGFTGGTLVQGDSRRLREVLAGAQVGCVAGSPPWHGSQEGASVAGPSSGMWKGYEKGFRPSDDGPIYASSQEQYGTTPGQLGAMPVGAVVSSPPWNQSLAGGDGVADRANWFADRPKTQANHHGGKVGRSINADYGLSPGQLGAEPDTFWAASAQIMTELAALLPPGAVCVWVLKAYVSKKAIVPFPDQWRQLCEAHGFTLVEEIHASLVEHHGTQEGLFDGPDIVQTARKSFFRRLAERRGSPRIDHETVLILERS